MCMIFTNEVVMPQADVTYLAFRVAFCETLERITLAHQFPDIPQDEFGFLTEVPFLSNVAPGVQLDLLSQTWERHYSEAPVEASLLDESVIYSVCERASWCLNHEPQEIIKRWLKNGPQSIHQDLSPHLAEQFSELYWGVSADADFLLISQFEDMPPGMATEAKNDWGIDSSRMAPLFEALGEWHPSAQMIPRLTGLLTEREMRLVSDQFNFPAFVR